MLTSPLLPKLRALRLSGVALTLDTRAAQASQSNLTPIEFLALILEDELERRGQQRLHRQVQDSGVEPTKTLARFDFHAVPTLNRSLVTALAVGAFIGRGENVLLCGPTGTGKTHLANAIAYEALKRGQTVLVCPTHRVLADLQAARAIGVYPRRFAKLCGADLVVLDDFGLRPVTPQGAEDLYDLIRERYEQKSLLITSNRAFAEWPAVFGDGLLASAALDRLTHHCTTLVIEGKSYRQRGRDTGGDVPSA